MTGHTSADDVAAHWERVHRDRSPADVSWYEATPDISLAMLDELGIDPRDPVIDVGAGSSGLGASLLERGFTDITALDVADAALQVARGRLGERAREIDWITADLLTWKPARRYSVWHDRAVFHFLTDDDQRERYRDLLHSALAPGGAIIIATFAEDGPRQCSGLPACGYDPATLVATLGPGFTMHAARREEHRTPAGAVQPFTWVGARLGPPSGTPR